MKRRSSICLATLFLLTLLSCSPSSRGLTNQADSSAAVCLLSVGSKTRQVAAPKETDGGEKVFVSGPVRKSRAETARSSALISERATSHTQAEKEGLLRKHSMEVREWLTKQQALVSRVARTGSDFDSFMASQRSGGGCAVRMMRAKEMLERMTKEASDLTQEIAGFEQVLAAETESLNITALAIQGVEQEGREANDGCHADHHEAEQDFDAMTQEREELEEMSDPALRFDVASGTYHAHKDPFSPIRGGENVYCAGNELTRIEEMMDLNQCRDACAERDDCKGYTIYKESDAPMRCILYDACPDGGIETAYSGEVVAYHKNMICEEALSGIGLDYRGCQDHTRDGYSCREWSARWIAQNPDEGLGEHNFCRNPDNDSGGIWCWTTSGSSKSWDYCNPKEEGEEQEGEAGPRFEQIVEGQACGGGANLIDQTTRDEATTASVELCYEHCRSNAECTYFSYFANVPACRRFRGCPESGWTVTASQPVVTYQMMEDGASAANAAGASMLVLDKNRCTAFLRYAEKRRQLQLPNSRSSKTTKVQPGTFKSSSFSLPTRATKETKLPEKKKPLVDPLAGLLKFFPKRKNYVGPALLAEKTTATSSHHGQQKAHGHAHQHGGESLRKQEPPATEAQFSANQDVPCTQIEGQVACGAKTGCGWDTKENRCVEKVTCCDYFELPGKKYPATATVIDVAQDTQEAAMHICDYEPTCTGVVHIQTGQFVAMNSSAAPEESGDGETLFPRSTCTRLVGGTCSRQVGGDPETCERERETLQTTYATAYEQIVNQQRDAQLRVRSLPGCLEDAQAEMSAELVPLVEARDASTERSMHAAQSIAATAPVLSTTKEHLEAMVPHMEELRQECLEGDEVSEHLAAVRAMIMNMQTCPGRNGFDLALPSHVHWDPNA